MFPVSDLSLLATEPQAKQRSVLLDGGHGDKPRPCRSAKCHLSPSIFQGSRRRRPNGFAAPLTFKRRMARKRVPQPKIDMPHPQRQGAAPLNRGCRTLCRMENRIGTPSVPPAKKRFSSWFYTENSHQKKCGWVFLIGRIRNL